MTMSEVYSHRLSLFVTLSPASLPANTLFTAHDCVAL